MILGTIEPRKNHAILLDVWKWFEGNLPTNKIPHLDIVGARGWQNSAVFRRLDRETFMGKTVHEHGAVSDLVLAGFLRSAQALLFPSQSEGFGLPVVEALECGLPVICSDLPVLREIVGPIPRYLPLLNLADWTQAILDEAAKTSQKTKLYQGTTWDQHFTWVFQGIDALS